MDTSFDDSLKQDFSTLDSTPSVSSETAAFGQDFHANPAFDHQSSHEAAYQADHFSMENHLNDFSLGSGHIHHAMDEGDVNVYSNREEGHQNFDPSNPGGEVIGNPSYDMQFWHKQSFNDCDIVSQQMGLESLTAQHFSESALLHEAIKDGSHLSSGGTPANYIGHLYETHGFPIERHHEGTLDEIQQKLAEGQKIVVAVNSSVLWTNEAHIPEFNTFSANHSVEVIGVVYPYGDHDHPKVILNDPGLDNGQGIMVPLEQFEKAWATSQHLIVTTSLPDTHTVLKDVYSDMARAEFLTNPNSLGTPSTNDSYQFEQAVEQRAQAMREREASLQREQEYERERAQRLVQEQQTREEEARREQLREEQRREEALREQQRQEREQQQREEQQRAEQLKAEQRHEEMLREERQTQQQNQNY